MLIEAEVTSEVNAPGKKTAYATNFMLAMRPRSVGYHSFE